MPFGIRTSQYQKNMKKTEDILYPLPLPNAYFILFQKPLPPVTRSWLPRLVPPAALR